MNRRDFLKYLSAIGITSWIPINIMAEQKRNGFVEFAENNFKIYHYKHGLRPFKINYAEELSNLCENNKRLLVKKYRQGGFTTFSIAWALYNCLTKEDQKFLILLKTDRELTSNINPYIIDPICDNLSDDLKLKIRKRNDHEIEFYNGNIIRMLIPLAARGAACNTLIIDEAAFIEDMDRHFTAFYPCVSSTDGNILVLSTPNGRGNWFHKNWESGNWYNYAANVYDHPNYNDLEEIKLQLGDKGFRQEILGEFI